MEHRCRARSQALGLARTECESPRPTDPACIPVSPPEEPISSPKSALSETSSTAAADSFALRPGRERIEMLGAVISLRRGLNAPTPSRARSLPDAATTINTKTATEFLGRPQAM